MTCLFMVKKAKKHLQNTVLLSLTINFLSINKIIIQIN